MFEYPRKYFDDDERQFKCIGPRQLGHCKIQSARKITKTCQTRYGDEKKAEICCKCARRNNPNRAAVLPEFTASTIAAKETSSSVANRERHRLAAHPRLLLGHCQ